jgi:predicted ABC-type ATPase
VSSADAVPCIYVLAGTNGAGKSSIGGAALLRHGAKYFDPDAATRGILSANPGVSQDEANSAAWQEGKRLLERSIAERLQYAFETTLGGRTICALLVKALSAGMEVRVWYAGLSSPELHIARVRSRVQKGGHDVPEAKIRDRYDSGRINLIRLLPRLTELRLYDNSRDADLDAGIAPEPTLLLHMKRGSIASSCELPLTPEWAKPILAAAFKRRPRS